MLFLILLEVLNIAGATLEDCEELGVTSSQDFRDLTSKWFMKRRQVLGIL